jgi:NADH-quinone oxidoreductase subunit L
MPFAAIASALGGVVLAWLEFGRQGADQVGFVEKIAPLNNLFAQRWYIDRFYRRFLDIFIYGVVSNLFNQNDKKVIDGGIDGLGKGTVATGRFVSILHQGMVQYRLLTIFVVLVLLGLYFFF